MQNKYLPTVDMLGGNLRLEITLGNVFDGVVATGRNSNGIFVWIAESVELMLEYAELNSEASKMISA
jgi:hypothetical protein